MASAGTLRRVALVRTDVSEELSASFMRVTRINVVPGSQNLLTLMKEALSSYETSALTRATQYNIPEDAIPHSHRGENLKYYGVRTGNRIYCTSTTLCITIYNARS
jgi:hypothetical protein